LNLATTPPLFISKIKRINTLVLQQNPTTSMTNSEAPSASTHQLLTATYTSPTNDLFTHTTRLLAPTTTNPTDRTTYLSSLRNAVAVMQEKINNELTMRMEEDKTREAAIHGTSNTNVKSVDETKEEDNYGEEVPEEN
jgi:hypothetical protein